MLFHNLTLDELEIDDERSFRHVGLYDELKQVLRRDGYRFRVLATQPRSWDRVLFLNLTYWEAGNQGDVLASASLPADVVMHVALHHLTRHALERRGAQTSADALFFGEAIASAFDLYLVGRLIGHAADSEFLETQVSAMSDVTLAAGLSADDFEALLREVAREPERAFEDLRQLLFDATTTLLTCTGVEAAAEALQKFDGHRFGALLHHYELSNWVLYARANAPGALTHDPIVRGLDATLRNAEVSLDSLTDDWLSSSKERGD